LDKINAYEEEIRRELNNLKSLCDEEEKEIVSTSCESACKKYSECTHYTEDTTEQDRKDAYDSCMIECVNRSDKTKICINKKPIKTVMDCTHLSICALSEYSNVMDKTKRK
jgi:leucyl-tRNA synthetase